MDLLRQSTLDSNFKRPKQIKNTVSQPRFNGVEQKLQICDENLSQGAV